MHLKKKKHGSRFAVIFGPSVSRHRKSHKDIYKTIISLGLLKLKSTNIRSNFVPAILTAQKVMIDKKKYT